MKDKVVLITGAAAGIGRETALAFAEKGLDVVAGDIDLGGLEDTVEMVRKRGCEVLAVEADISNPHDVMEMVKSTIQQFGRLDYAVNNAGIEGTSATTVEYTVEQWDRVMNVNLRGQWLCMKYEIPEMLKNSGAIVNVSSILGKVGYAQAPAYTAAKHGLVGLTKAAALEYAAEGIRINAICPAFIDTPMLERAGITTKEENLEYIKSLHPLGRLGTAREVANAIVWLASDEASYITGHTLLVDGGYTAR